MNGKINLPYIASDGIRTLNFDNTDDLFCCKYLAEKTQYSIQEVHEVYYKVKSGMPMSNWEEIIIKTSELMIKPQKYDRPNT